MEWDKKILKYFHYFKICYCTCGILLVLLLLYFVQERDRVERVITGEIESQQYEARLEPTSNGDEVLVITNIPDLDETIAPIIEESLVSQARGYFSKVELAFWGSACLIAVLVACSWMQHRLLQKTMKSYGNVIQKKDEIIFQQAKMAGVGQITGDIIHQWKQPLNALMLILSNLKWSYHETIEENNIVEENAGAFDELVVEADQTIQFLADTADHFRHFVTKGSEMEFFDTSQAIDYVIGFYTEKLRNGILLTKRQEGNTNIYGNRNQFMQVIVNLLGNAVDAIAAQHREGKIEIVLLENRKQLEISVEDNGGGIPKKIQPYIFDVNYSTKKEGNGLGLYICKSIIENNFQGNLSFELTEEGTRFLIVIPKWRE